MKKISLLPTNNINVALLPTNTMNVAKLPTNTMNDQQHFVEIMYRYNPLFEPTCFNEVLQLSNMLDKDYNKKPVIYFICPFCRWECSHTINSISNSISNFISKNSDKKNNNQNIILTCERNEDYSSCNRRFIINTANIQINNIKSYVFGNENICIAKIPLLKILKSLNSIYVRHKTISHKIETCNAILQNTLYEKGLVNIINDYIGKIEPLQCLSITTDYIKKIAYMIPKFDNIKFNDDIEIIFKKEKQKIVDRKGIIREVVKKNKLTVSSYLWDLVGYNVNDYYLYPQHHDKYTVNYYLVTDGIKSSIIRTKYN